MSQENVELTLLALDTYNRRDAEAAIALMDPEIVWYPALEGVTEGRAYRGHAGTRQYYEDLAEFSERSHAEFPEVHDLGDQVLGLGHLWFRFATKVLREYRDPDGFALGHWIREQRQNRRRRRISEERARRLEALPGWTWEPRKAGARG